MCCDKRSSSAGVIILFFCLVSLGKHIYLNSAQIHVWWNQYAWYRKEIWWLGGVGARVWSLKEGKNMCHIYTHYLTWQRSVLTIWTRLQNAGSHLGAFYYVNGVSKCEETVGLDATCTWLVNLWSKNIYMYATQTIKTPITTSLLNRHRATKRTELTEIHKSANPLKLPNSQGNWYTQNRPAQESTPVAQITEIPWSNPLKHATHLVHWNTFLLHRPLGFYSMKQTISTIYPPPPHTHTHKHTHTPSPAFLSSFIAMQHLKHLNGISLADRWLLDIVCWLG